MKSKIIMIVLSSIALTCISFADPLPDLIKIEVVARSESIVDEKIESKILSKPSVTTRLGNEAIMRVVSEFTTEVPGHEEMTKQEGIAGIIMSVSPNYTDSNILLKGVVEILKGPAFRTFEDKGSIAVQESCKIQFSLKLIENTPFKLSPIEMPDGTKLFLTFLTSREPNVPLTPEEIEKLKKSGRYFSFSFDLEKPNQALQPTVKTPVESGKVQGTAAEL